MRSHLLFFSVRSNGSASACPFSINNNAANDFSVFVNELVSRGYLAPGNPKASTIVAFYPVDEPELCGLKDQGGNPHPALRHAVNVIRGNQSTYNFPLFSISSKKYGDAIRGLNLMDWVGMQNYSSSTAGYISQFSTFENRLSPRKRSVLVPQAAYGGMMSEYGSPHDPQMIIEKYLGSGKAIGIMPFLWHHDDTTGVGSNPVLREQYRTIGNHIANNRPLPFRGGVGCIGGGGLFECFAHTFGGTPPYFYNWNPVPASGNGKDWAAYSFSCGVNNIVRLTITDSSSNSWTGSTTAYCPPGSQPLHVD